MENANQILNICERLAGTSSGNEKLAILKEVKDTPNYERVLKYAYNGDKYNVNVKNLCVDSTPSSYNDVFEILDALCERTITGNEAVAEASRFVCTMGAEGEMLRRILKHDLDDGIGRSTITKVFPNMFSTFGVALANKWSPKFAKKIDFAKEEWFVSRKLDGVRCICIKRDNNVQFFARSGKPFTTLGVLEQEIAKIDGDFVLDGECCIVDENGDENFTDIIKEIKRKDHTIINPCYQVFDKLTIEEFESHTSERKFSERYSDLACTIEENYIGNVKLVEQCLVTDETFEEWKNKAAENGWEGVMLRKNATYQGKRTDDMLKVKEFQDDEYTVLECVNGILKFTEDHRQVEREALSNIVIEHKGSRVSVGSGFSKEQRIFYGQHPEKLIGKTITVKYFQESQNQNGSYSLRFPTVKFIYEDERDC